MHGGFRALTRRSGRARSVRALSFHCKPLRRALPAGQPSAIMSARACFPGGHSSTHARADAGFGHPNHPLAVPQDILPAAVATRHGGRSGLGFRRVVRSYGGILAMG